MYYPSPNVSRPASQLTEEEQIKIAQRIGLIQHLPTGSYDGSKKNREWVVTTFKIFLEDVLRDFNCSLKIFRVGQIPEFFREYPALA